MIAYDTNGTSLYFIDAMGIKVSRGPNDGQEYQSMLDTLGAQLAAIRANKDAVDAYAQKIHNAQVNEDASKPYPPVPASPQEIVVDNYGGTTHRPFSPPLQGLIRKVSNAPGSGSIVTPTVDRNAIMQNQISAIFHKMFPDA